MNKARHELKAERTYCHNLQLVIHSQRGRMAGLRREINDIKATIEEIKRQRLAGALPCLEIPSLALRTLTSRHANRGPNANGSQVRCPAWTCP